MRLYLAGPMTGIEDYNFPLFIRTAENLRQIGHEVFNPAEDVQNDPYLGRAFYMRRDIFAIIGQSSDDSPVDAVALLEGWEVSRGTRLEVETALQLDIPVIWASNLLEGKIVPLTQEELDKTKTIACLTYMSILNEGVAA